MVIYNSGRRSSYIIIRKGLNKQIKKTVQPTLRQSLSKNLYQKLNDTYIKNTVPLIKDYKKYGDVLTFEEYLSEIVMIIDKEYINYIKNNKRKLKIKLFTYNDNVTFINYFTFGPNYFESEDEMDNLVKLLGGVDYEFY